MHAFAQKLGRPIETLLPSFARLQQSRSVLPENEHDHLQFQRTVGNQGVLRMLQSPAAERDAKSGRAENQRFGHDFSRIPIHAPATGVIQTKLEVNQPGDEYEQEADRVSEEVMRMPEPLLQRKCACGGNSGADGQCAEGRKKRLQRKAAAVQSGGMAPPIVHEVLRSPGQPLDAATRAFMEPRFGHDFGHVRIHTDARAAKSARAINALAYTVGNNITISQGQASASSRLLAHELTHVIQQDGVAARQTEWNTGVRSFASTAGTGHSGKMAGVIFRAESDSRHPEEQNCKDLSESGTDDCPAIIECINDLILRLEIRLNEFEGEPGHEKRYNIVRNILKRLLGLAFTADCDRKGYADEIEWGKEWADKPLKRQKTTEEQLRELRERLPSVPNWVWWTLGAAAVALIAACFASGACAAGAIIAALGESIGWLVINAFRLAGVGVLATSSINSTQPSGSGSLPVTGNQKSSMV